MAKKKVISYSEKNYQQGKDIFDTLVKCVDEIKYGEVHTASAWNMPIEKLNGLTMRLIGEDHVEIIYHHIEIGTVDEMAKQEIDEDGKKFVKEVVKELKKKFKSKTGKALTMKEEKTDRYIEKISRMLADTSWIMGYNRRPVGKFLVRDIALYNISSAL